ncbi:hypothetical protein EYF80_057257 [Liparis tanakae]|uniref:Uncharacterized protein n=1 Tax=Liparis tanakae TaxID=230148 RepID=A0A4Z2EVL2_9TELE|nr:hypothetical protein EYF80_057257 [Liparis tanakae]
MVPTTPESTQCTASEDTNQVADGNDADLSALPDEANSPEGSVPTGGIEPGLNLTTNDAVEETAYSPTDRDSNVSLEPPDMDEDESGQVFYCDDTALYHMKMASYVGGTQLPL